ncbi:otospiralin isoform X2 [Brienomyrus brachyistius]|uniref:otospiralin isoform X2 n=1 Tax=Brienomyrus brachyistius TaxID=42636 RepID=UPI0020B3CCA7|nr:otospiralin isoform X2 [Brienomyrus brachyistius]
MRTENPRLLLIVYLCWGSQAQPTESAPSITNVPVGGNFQFPFTTGGNQSYRADLKFNSTVLIVTWIFQSPPFINVNYEGRVKILENLIQLDNLQLSDSGFYRLDIGYLTQSTSQSGRFILQVSEPVSKPSITTECLGSNVTLTCNSKQGSNVEYVWESAPPCGESCLLHLGPVVEIAFSNTSSSLYYTCTAWNAVSNETSDPLELNLCPIEPAGFNWIVALLIVIPTLLLAGAVIYIQRRRRRGSNIADTPEPVTDGFLSSVTVTDGFLSPVTVTDEFLSPAPVTDEFLSPAPTIEPVYIQELRFSSNAV